MVTVPFDYLPFSLPERHGRLRSYFCDKDASATETADGWQLDLYWANDPERYVDPLLDIGLTWWPDRPQRSEMVLARRREGRVMTALYDTWTLHSWSEWLARSGRPDLTVTILHADDHRDLGSPRLVGDGSTGWRDMITGAALEMTNPASVEAAILSGAIGMGSFLTSFLVYAPSCVVRHLCQPPKVTMSHVARIVPGTIKDDFLYPGRERPAITLQPDNVPVGPGTYLATSDVETWASDIPDGPILVHIDLDYLNNRYDGDSDWTSRAGRLDPEEHTVLQKLTELIERLSRVDVANRIVDLSVVFSPGFFPAEFWAVADTHLRQGLRWLYER